jgi:RNA polymerase sigma-70 factor, ECF subfamily
MKVVELPQAIPAAPGLSLGYGINSPTEDMIPTRDGPDQTLMAQQPAPPSDDHAWAIFEAEALPHVDRLFRLALWFERNRHEAEDLVQETMMQALQSFHRFQPGTNCRAWLVTILQHVRSNRRRARQRSPLVDDPEDRLANTIPFIAPVPETLTDDDMLGALGRIPVQFQEVIVLCDVEELTYKEIADTLAIPLGTVMSRLHRGRALLRSELGAGRAVGDQRSET